MGLKFHVKHEWYVRQYHNPRLNSEQGVDYAKHFFLVGKSNTGKTYIAFWFAEKEVLDGISKFVYISGWNRRSVNEALGLGFGRLTRNPVDYREYAATKTFPLEWQEKIDSGEIKVKVYVPLLGNVPDELPENHVPFTMPLKDLGNANIGEPAVRVLFSGKEHKAYYTKLSKAISRLDNNDSFPELWTEIQLEKKSPPSGYEKIDGIDWYVGDTAIENPQELAVLLNKLSPFRESQFISSSKHPFNLHELMRKELKDQKTIVILDLEYIEDELLKLFCMIYFQSTLNYVMGEENLYQKIKHGILVYYDDAGDYLKGARNKTSQESDLAFSAFFSTMITKIRKSHITLMLSIQSPTFLDGLMMSNMDMMFITELVSQNDIEWAAKHLNEQPSTLTFINRELRIKRMLYRDYRFLVNEKNITQWQNGKIIEYGCKLPRPRLSETKEIETGDSPKDLARVLGIETTDLPKLLLQEQNNDYRNRALKAKEKLKKERPAETTQDSARKDWLLVNAMPLMAQKASKRQLMKELKCSIDTVDDTIRRVLASGGLPEPIAQYYNKQTTEIKEDAANFKEMASQLPAEEFN